MLVSRKDTRVIDQDIETKSSSAEEKKSLSSQKDVIKSLNVAIDINPLRNDDNDAKSESKESKESKEPLSHYVNSFKKILFLAIENKELTEVNFQAFVNTPEARSVAKYLFVACVILPIGLVSSLAVGIARESTDDAMQGVFCTILASLVTSSPFWYKLIKHGCTRRSNIITRLYTTLLPDDQELVKSEGEKIGLTIEPTTTIENILDQVTLLEKDLTEKTLLQSFFNQADKKGIGHQSNSSTKHPQAVFDGDQGLGPIVISYLFPPRVSDAAPPEESKGLLGKLRNYFGKNS